MTNVDDVGQIDIKEVLREKAPALARKLPAFVVNYLIRISHQDELNDILDRYHDKDGVDFMTELIDYFDLNLIQRGEENLPAKGRYIFASNHPLGGLDGICLASILGNHYQGKVRVPVNDILLFIPNLRSIFIPVNKHGRQARETAVVTEEAYASDNQIVTFPAGLCSRIRGGKIVDLDWKKSFIQKAVEYKRSIVPVYFDGRNSKFFYRLANLRKSLGIKANIEMLYLADELFKSKHSTYTITFGKPVPWTTFERSRSRLEWVEWMKQKTYDLKDNESHL